MTQRKKRRCSDQSKEFVVISISPEGKQSRRRGDAVISEKKEEERRDFQDGPCKRRCLRCERDVVHPGKSFSRAALADGWNGLKRHVIQIQSLTLFFSFFLLQLGCGRLQETPEADTARGQAVRWSAWGGAGFFSGGRRRRRRRVWGLGWLTLKVPLTLSPH